MKLNWRWRVFAAVAVMQVWRGVVMLDPSPIARAVEYRAVWPWLYWAAAACCALAAVTRSARTQVLAGTMVGGVAILRAVALVDALGFDGAGTAFPDSLALVSVIAGSWGFTARPLHAAEAIAARQS